MCLKFDGHEIEAIATIHDGLGHALVEDPKGDDGSLMNDPEGSDKGMEEIKDPLETRGRTMNIKDPSGMDHAILLHEAELHFMGEAPRIVSHRHSCYWCVVPPSPYLTTLWMSCLSY